MEAKSKTNKLRVPLHVQLENNAGICNLPFYICVYYMNIGRYYSLLEHWFNHAGFMLSQIAGNAH